MGGRCSHGGSGIAPTLRSGWRHVVRIAKGNIADRPLGNIGGAGRGLPPLRGGSSARGISRMAISSRGAAVRIVRMEEASAPRRMGEQTTTDNWARA